ncbi:hypothetical protein FJTKL_14060 [Diaporthe vaccinii]|uniref:Uncharacterized protein n=1 Tax=Diaporthe vaccinii TaxID=105482 RepID=A0ABR4E8W5_9PEZI
MLNAEIESVSTGNVEPACEDCELAVKKMYLVDIAHLGLELVDQSSLKVISIENINAHDSQIPQRLPLMLC